MQNGASMLKVAEGAIQSQINLLRTVKERVINAHNDTNTDADRLIIQKEITNYYNEINDIAAETTFNQYDPPKMEGHSTLIADDHALLSQYDPLNLAGRSTDSRRLL